MEESCDGHCSPTTSPNMMCIQCVSMYWHSEGQQTAGPPSHCKPTASPPHPTLTAEKLVRRCRRKHPHWDKLFKTILHIRQGCRDKTDTRGKHERQSSPSLPPPPDLLLPLACVLLSPWHAAFASSVLACAPLPGPVSCPGRCLYQGISLH